MVKEIFSIEAIIVENKIKFKVSEFLVVQFVGAINSLYNSDIVVNNLQIEKQYQKINSTVYSYETNDIEMELFYESLHGIHSIFIYSDVIDTQIVGDSRTRLLRVINVSSKYKEVVSRVYDNPDYLPVSSREINSIKIILRDDTGQKIFFTNSKVIVKLHFRKKAIFLMEDFYVTISTNKTESTTHLATPKIHCIQLHQLHTQNQKLIRYFWILET